MVDDLSPLATALWTADCKSMEEYPTLRFWEMVATAAREHQRWLRRSPGLPCLDRGTGGRAMSYCGFCAGGRTIRLAERRRPSFSLDENTPAIVRVNIRTFPCPACSAGTTHEAPPNELPKTP